jgi:hypothetical protein
LPAPYRHGSIKMMKLNRIGNNLGLQEVGKFLNSVRAA